MVGGFDVTDVIADVERFRAGGQTETPQRFLNRLGIGFVVRGIAVAD